jgi:hypothetical protein|tara:strand:- start:398 stop:541 length:144 start_codon:yes stop_codon:yes gene_type:complete
MIIAKREVGHKFKPLIFFELAFNYWGSWSAVKQMALRQLKIEQYLNK